MPGGRRVWVPKKVNEVVTIPFDFTSDLLPEETILTAIVRANVYSGEDANPSLIRSGSASIDGTVVNQNIRGGISGTIYGLVCKVTTSEGQTVEISAFCAVGTDLP